MLEPMLRKGCPRAIIIIIESELLTSLSLLSSYTPEHLSGVTYTIGNFVLHFDISPRTITCHMLVCFLNMVNLNTFTYYCTHIV